MKKITLIICMIVTLMLTSCETYGQFVSTSPYELEYEYVYNDNPVFLVDGTYYWYVMIDNMWYYRPLPREYWYGVRHFDYPHRMRMPFGPDRMVGGPVHGRQPMGGVNPGMRGGNSGMGQQRTGVNHGNTQRGMDPGMRSSSRGTSSSNGMTRGGFQGSQSRGGIQSGSMRGTSSIGGTRGGSHPGASRGGMAGGRR